MHSISKFWTALGPLSLLCAGALTASCDSSDSETAENGGTSGSGGSSATGGSSKGGSSMGGSSMGGTSQGGTSGAGGDGGEPATGGTGQGGTGGDGTCMSKSSFTLATHVTLNVSWPSSLAVMGGEGVVHVWDIRRIEVSGTDFTSETQPCGTMLPPLSLSAIAGGGQSLLEVPAATWDLASMPKIDGGGTLSGFSPGSSFVTDAQTTLIGHTMDDPDGAWPDDAGEITPVDHDGDSNDGITSIPRTDGDFVRPPTSIIGQSGDVADQVYLVTRSTFVHDGEFTSCTDIEGTTMISAFDNHVVGCHVFEGDECSDGQADFIDSNRTVYEVTSATFQSKLLDDAVTCVDARDALPP
jgi:hypothetical protein